MSELRFDGRVAIVTGAGRGLGRNLALAMAARGAKVLVNDLGVDLAGADGREPVAEQVAAEIRALGGQAIANSASVSDEDGVRSIASDALAAFGRIDIIANSAGITAHRPFDEHSFDTLRRSMEIMYFGSVNLTHAAWPTMVGQGYGRVLNFVSSSIFGLPGYSAYVAAKGALFALTRSLALEGAPHGIGINAVSPVAATRMTLSNPNLADRAEWISTVFDPAFILPVALYLLHESCTLKGEVLGAAGGEVTAWRFGETQGIIDRAMTPESLAVRINEVLAGEAGIYANQGDQNRKLSEVSTPEILRQMGQG
jgi:NAD(P)-dependent dehydrogenase (short-subunit alcohol dehydrogenase family)